MSKKCNFAQTTYYMARKRKNNSKYSLIIIVVSLLTIAGIIFFRKTSLPKTENQIENEEDNKNYISDCDHVHFASAPIAPSSKLNDPNEKQLIHAQKNGLKKPFVSNLELSANIEALKAKSVLVEVKDNKFYQLKTLKYSHPYLIPETVDMLNEIGYRFQQRLKEKKHNNYKFRITSMLRTEETQNKLHHHNGNATEHSTHLYGTTVDISYKNFYNTKKDTVEASFEAVQAMTKVLIEMRKECKLMAVRERHQSCFHITVVVCKPVPTKK